MPSVIRYLIPGIVSACVITQTPILAQPARPADPPLRNWKTAPYWTPAAAETARTGGLRPLDSTANSNATPLAYVAITPCRLLDTRALSGMTGAFGPPSLAADSSHRRGLAQDPGPEFALRRAGGGRLLAELCPDCSARRQRRMALCLAGR